jgi:hypothetical protein
MIKALDYEKSRPALNNWFRLLNLLLNILLIAHYVFMVAPLRHNIGKGSSE